MDLRFRCGVLERKGQIMTDKGSIVVVIFEAALSTKPPALEPKCVQAANVSFLVHGYSETGGF
jgi:hypothetical protein